MTTKALALALLCVIVGDARKHTTKESLPASDSLESEETLPDDDGGMQVWIPEWWAASQHQWALVDKEKLNPAAEFQSLGREDEYALEHYFSGKIGGTYLEVGGNNGKFLSNTYYLGEALGWRGVLIEANPKEYANMVNNRKSDINVHAAVCDVRQTVHFFDSDPNPEKGTGTVIGGIVEFMAESFKETHFKDRKDILEAPAVTCLPLRDILQKLGVHHLDFWSLDVEGGELKVLQTFNFDVVTVDVVVIEADGHDAEKDQAVVDLMVASGFRHEGSFERNAWFVHKSFLPHPAVH